MNFEYYEVFYHICAHGSLTATAQGPCISQLAVSQAARQLGKEAGTKLFLRTSEGIQLTREGELLYHYIKPGTEELLEDGKILEWILNMDVGEVRIGASDMMLRFYPLPYLEQFHREYPKIRVSVTNTLIPEAVKSLEEGRIDLGVAILPFTSRGTARQFQIKVVCNVSIAGNNFRELEGRELEYKEPEVFPCMVLKKDTSTRTFVNAFLTQRGVLLKSEFELTINGMIVQFARRNMGIGCAMKGFVEDAIMRDEVS